MAQVWKGKIPPAPPFEKGGLGGILRLGPSPVHCTALNATSPESPVDKATPLRVNVWGGLEGR